VVRAGLIEAAVPPSPRKSYPAPPPQQQPAAITISPQGPPPNPATTKLGTPIERAPSADSTRAADQPAARKTKPAFIIRGITSNLPASLAPSEADGNLVTKRKTEFVSERIAPASPATIPPTLPLVVPADQERQSAEPLVDSDPRDSASPERETPTPQTHVAQERQLPTPADARPEPPSNQSAHAKLVPAPVEVAPTPPVVEPAPPSEKLSVDKSPTPIQRNVPPAPPATAATPPTKAVAEADRPSSTAPLGVQPEAMPLADEPGDEGGATGQYTKLPWNEPTARSPQLVAATKRADGHVVHGYELASRGALYSARAEFTTALKLIAQAYDAQEGTRHHTKAAAAGLAALKEAADFARHARSLRDVDLSTIILPHSTPVLKDGDTSELTPMAATQLYYSYAQEQLAAAVAQEICGSMALYAMGKVETMVAKSEGPSLESTARATALYRASLIAYAKNYRAANELAVLMAENGQYELARDLLIRSVSVSPQVTTWKNLAAVYGRLGQRDLAEHAKQHALAVERQGHKESAAPQVKWVDAATFASTTPVSDSLPVSVPPATQQPPAEDTDDKTPNKPPVNVAKRSVGDWIRLGPRR
jgi:tetratricopeptide (TPR) repeat protein